MGHVIIVAATNHRAVNAAVSRAANAACLPVNVVDDPQLSSFIVPSIVDRDPITIAISSDGVAPVFARLLRARIEAAVPNSLGRAAELAGRLRKLVRRRLPDIANRRRFWETMFEGRVGALALAGRTDEAEALAAEELARAERAEIPGQVALVGAGPGDPDLLTFAALRLLQSADVIVHDRLVSEDILDLARREADRIDVGKAGGAKSASQEDINALIVRLAREGKRVVRLKGGDPVPVWARRGGNGGAGRRRHRRARRPGHHRRRRLRRRRRNPAHPSRPRPRLRVRLGPPPPRRAGAGLGRAGTA